jgi:hypothetical protein
MNKNYVAAKLIYIMQLVERLPQENHVCET